MFVYLKRSHTVVILTLCLFFFLFTIWRRDRQAWLRHEPIYTPKSLWRQLPTRYPVETLRQLPAGAAKQLPRVQHSFDPETDSARSVREGRRAEVREQAQKCWKSYHDYAWMYDELTPLTGKGIDHFGGWAATLVDSLDTLWIMDLTEEFNMSVTAIMDIDFEKPGENQLNVFETTIRYLGGFLSAYDLSGDINLLRKAAEIGEMLLVAFDTPNRMPVARWNPQHALQGVQQEAQEVTLIAEIGSLGMEFIRLSQLTNDARWFDAVQKITEVAVEQQNSTKLPGMWPMLINAKDANFTVNPVFTLSAMADSFYEYFPKIFALLGGLDSTYRQMYETSMDVAIKHLFFRPMVPDNADILISGVYQALDRKSFLHPEGQHLGCYVGGMLALGGKLFGIPEHVDLGVKVTNGCVWAYKNSPHSIMPEKFTMVPCRSKTSCQWDENQYLFQVSQKNTEDEVFASEMNKKHQLPPGFTSITDRRYILRPEAIESVFIMYRITGDQHWQEIAWEMWEAIQKTTQTELANAALADVTTEDPPQQMDSMESFWLAETLKYFYLIFSEPELISLDDYVLNTEAHPFKRPGRSGQST